MKAKHYPLLLLIVLVALSAYSNSFTVPFQFDDYANIVDNPAIRDLGNFVSLFNASDYNSRRIIGYMSFALNYSVDKLDAVGYHIVNLVIHILNAILVYYLVLLTFMTPYFSNGQSAIRSQLDAKSNFNDTFHESSAKGGPAVAGDSRFFVAFFSSIFFVAHPVQTQAVTYIVQRFTSLATLFYLLSLVMYIKARLSAQRRSAFPSILYALCSLLSAVLAVKTKEIAFTLPAAILLFEFSFFHHGDKKKRFFVLTLAAIIILAFFLFNLSGLKLSGLAEQTKVQAEGSRWIYLMTEMRVIVTYIRLILFPINQNIDYDYAIYKSFFDPPVLLSFLLISAMFGAGLYLFYKSRVVGASPVPARGLGGQPQELPLQGSDSSLFSLRYLRLIAFGILWFFITLSVESSVIPIADVIFEHRVYLPSVGVFIALSSAAFALTEKFQAKTQRAVISCLIAVVMILAGATYLRNNVWQSPLTLWEDAAKKSPGNIRPLFSLAVEYAKVGQYERAIEMYLKALAVPPKEYLSLRKNEYPKVYNGLGMLYAQLGRYDEAIAVFRMIPNIDPEFIDAYNNLGAAFINSGRYEEAIAPLRHVVEKKPDHLDAHYNLALSYLVAGSRDEAMKEYFILKQLSPELASELYVKIAQQRDSDKRNVQIP